MQTIDTQQLKEMRDTDQRFALINVLPEEAFRDKHIPGSANIPVGRDDFEQRVEQEVGGKDQPVVVYCASTDCDASPTAAKKLDQAGFDRVMDYEAGTKGWEDAGLPTES